MAEKDETQADTSAEKAYAEAAEAVSAAPADVKKDVKAVSKSPAKTKRAAKPKAAAAKPEAPKVAPEGEPAPPVEPVKAAEPTTSSAAVKAKSAPKPKTVSRAKPKVAPKAAKPVKKPVRAKPVKAKPVRSAKPTVKKAPVAVAAKISIPSLRNTPLNSETKEMVMDMSAKFTDGLQGMMAEAQAKAQEAFEKSSGFFGDYSEFAKGNVEAMVESGKILAEGLQDMGTNLVAEGRTAFETISGDIKEMAAAKSPTDFFKVQSEMARKNFDTAVAYGSKNTEAMLKLASDVMAPLSGRVSLAVEKVRQAAV